MRFRYAGLFRPVTLAALLPAAAGPVFTTLDTPVIARSLRAPVIGPDVVYYDALAHSDGVADPDPGFLIRPAVGDTGATRVSAPRRYSSVVFAAASESPALADSASFLRRDDEPKSSVSAVVSAPPPPTAAATSVDHAGLASAADLFLNASRGGTATGTGMVTAPAITPASTSSNGGSDAFNPFDRDSGGAPLAGGGIGGGMGGGIGIADAARYSPAGGIASSQPLVLNSAGDLVYQNGFPLSAEAVPDNPAWQMVPLDIASDNGFPSAPPSTGAIPDATDVVTGLSISKAAFTPAPAIFEKRPAITAVTAPPAVNQSSGPEDASGPEGVNAASGVAALPDSIVDPIAAPEPSSLTLAALAIALRLLTSRRRPD